jgi:hypothetical protein
MDTVGGIETLESDFRYAAAGYGEVRAHVGSDPDSRAWNRRERGHIYVARIAATSGCGRRSYGICAPNLVFSGISQRCGRAMQTSLAALDVNDIYISLLFSIQYSH